MPKVEIPEDQILDSLDQLSPQARREAIRRLLPAADYLDRAVEQNQLRIEKLARDRGLNWNSMRDEQRQQLIDEIIHE